ncbi:hypothetical protein F4556_003769 [Kitasatospora gansuensis]|uniref:Uncharacterized protein n=2 Tax=Kitasatospora TaxID=2063 RepID=A0A7W7SD05_9ACTN|nr:hypothetical protein [Kitasatospora gansuensis]MBB4948234.1 hypothetical protein [Kitasatospora gansuensis]
MSRRTEAATALALCLATGLGTVIAAGPAHAAVPNVCGGAMTDYVGASPLLLPDAPFVGTVSLVGEKRAISITPVFLTANVLRTEIGTGDDARAQSGNFTLKVDSSGRGKISFPVYAGMASSTDVNCTPGLTPTRVTKINGKINVTGVEGQVDFVVTRT